MNRGYATKRHRCKTLTALRVEPRPGRSRAVKARGCVILGGWKGRPVVDGARGTAALQKRADEFVGDAGGHFGHHVAGAGGDEDKVGSLR